MPSITYIDYEGTPRTVEGVRFASKSTPIELLQYLQPTHLSRIRTTQERNVNSKKSTFSTTSVKSEKARSEHSPSGSPPKADIDDAFRHFRFCARAGLPAILNQSPSTARKGIDVGRVIPAALPTRVFRI